MNQAEARVPRRTWLAWISLALAGLAAAAGLLVGLDYVGAFGFDERRDKMYLKNHSYLFAIQGTKTLISNHVNVWVGPDDGGPLDGPQPIRTIVPGQGVVQVDMAFGFKSDVRTTRLFKFQKPVRHGMLLKFECPGYKPREMQITAVEYDAISVTNPLLVELEPQDDRG